MATTCAPSVHAPILNVIVYVLFVGLYRPRYGTGSEYDSLRFEGSGTGPIQNSINTFHRITDQAVDNQTLYTHVHTMLFSDCAFIDAGNSPTAALLASGCSTTRRRHCQMLR